MLGGDSPLREICPNGCVVEYLAKDVLRAFGGKYICLNPDGNLA